MNGDGSVSVDVKAMQMGIMYPAELDGERFFYQRTGDGFEVFGVLEGARLAAIERAIKAAREVEAYEDWATQRDEDDDEYNARIDLWSELHLALEAIAPPVKSSTP